MPTPHPPAMIETRLTDAERADILDAAWQTVNVKFFDPTFGGKDWQAIMVPRWVDGGLQVQRLDADLSRAARRRGGRTGAGAHSGCERHRRGACGLGTAVPGAKEMSRTRIISDDLWSEARRFSHRHSGWRKADLCFYLGVSIIL
jgi:hypothetical protein